MNRIEETLRGLQSDPSPSVREAASSSLDRLRAKRSVASYLNVLQTGTLEERMRVVFSAEDIGGAVAFFCSADADYITGQALNVDGGSVMH